MTMLPGLPTTEGTSEPLQGHLDWVDWRNFGGWALNPDDIDVPVWLEVQVDDRKPIRFLANMMRPDLADAGIGTGRYGFQLHFPKPLNPRKPHSVAIRRVSDGAELPNSPWELAVSAAAEPQALEAVSALISADIEAAAGQSDQLQSLSRFLVLQADRVLQAGADIDNGRRDRDLFRKRWSETLGGEPLEVASPDSRPLALFIGVDLPEQPAELALLQAAQSLGLRLMVVAARGLPATGPAAERLTQTDILVQGSPLHFTVEDVLRRHQGEFRLVMLQGAVAAGAYSLVSRLHQPRARILAWLDDPAQDPAASIAAQLTADAVITQHAASQAEFARRVQGRDVFVVPLAAPAAERDPAFARAMRQTATPKAPPDPS